MSIRKYAFAFGEFYHVYNRGNSKQVIFRDKSDYAHFQQLLFIANGTNSYVFRDVFKNNIFEFNRGDPLVAIGSYCLMPNHFHILLTPLVDEGVSKFLQKVLTGYSMYFNSKYERTGTLFEGKFKASWADSDQYLKYLFAYIHLNPVKLIDPMWKEKGIKDSTVAYEYTSTYKYSSFADYVLNQKRDEATIITPSAFPRYFSSVKDIQREIFVWLNFENLIKLTSKT